MAKDKPYSSILDAMLDDREPDWKALGMKDAKDSGEEIANRTQTYVDEAFINELSEGVSKHTPMPPKSGAILTNRISEKEKAAPRLNAVKENWHKDARRDAEDYKNSYGDNDSLMAEVTMDIQKAEGGATVEKKEISDGQIQTYIRNLLNQGTSPAKVAAQLEKLAEVELFNHQISTDYLQRNAGMMGLAYLEPNTFMDKQNPNYRHTAASNDCVRQHTAWQQEGIKPQARSVKQISACKDCAYFKQSVAGKSCNLYHLPVIANADELSQIVNNLTPGVPNKRKHAALVQIANRMDQHAQPFNMGETTQINLVKTADAHVKNQARRTQPTGPKFYSDHVAKLHAKGVSLKQIYNWADHKFGSLDTSVAFRGFVQSLRKDAKGRIVIATADLQFLNHIGIRSESFEGAAKCASCTTHFGHDVKVENERGVMRVSGSFAERTPEAVRTATEKTKPVVITTDTVRKWRQAGNSMERIYNGVASKIGSQQAKKLVASFLQSLKKVPSKIGISEADRSFLVGKLGMKPEAVRTLESVRPAPVVNNTGDNRILAYPGMGKQAKNKPATDGHDILNEYELSRPVEGPEINTDGPDRLDVQTSSTMKIELE